eukprot:TRINITY_DN3568_c0_g1_i2.p2 TRINITY_DN3568_c0_g1~~TRINITY_DN3568_c0_g1_i2.p2  ORF type:complete len:131 (+),score=3.71 TRINITY_DN3568_c0_g1_i2:49-441(+)
MKLGFLSKVYKQKINWNQWKPFCSEVNENSVSKSLSNSKGQPIEREKDLKQRMAAMGFKEREVLRISNHQYKTTKQLPSKICNYMKPQTMLQPISISSVIWKRPPQFPDIRVRQRQQDETPLLWQQSPRY